ncbi:MAG: type II secretion system F family protein [Clostridiales bacterium]
MRAIATTKNLFTKINDNMLTAEELSLFFLQISLMLKSGILSVDGIALLEDEASSQREKSLLQTMKEVLEQGQPLYAAMAAVGSFPEHALRMVQIGEETGRLEQVLTALAQYYQQEHELRQSMRQAVLYPAWLAVVIALVTFVLVAKVLPAFQQVLEQLGSGLSPWAVSLMRLGIFSKWGVIVFAALLLALAFYLFFNSRRQLGQEKLRRLADTLFFRGALGLSAAREKFSSALALSLASGLNLNEALDKAYVLADEATMRQKIEQCLGFLEQGLTFAAAVENAGIFKGLEVGLVAAGFRAGAGEAVMLELSRRFHRQTEELLLQVMSRIEPVLVVLLVLVVGMLLLSVMLPLLAMMNAIGS